VLIAVVDFETTSLDDDARVLALVDTLRRPERGLWNALSILLVVGLRDRVGAGPRRRRQWSAMPAHGSVSSRSKVLALATRLAVDVASPETNVAIIRMRTS